MGRNRYNQTVDTLQKIFSENIANVYMSCSMTNANIATFNISNTSGRHTKVDCSKFSQKIVSDVDCHENASITQKITDDIVNQIMDDITQSNTGLASGSNIDTLKTQITDDVSSIMSSESTANCINNNFNEVTYNVTNTSEGATVDCNAVNQSIDATTTCIFSLADNQEAIHDLANTIIDHTSQTAVGALDAMADDIADIAKSIVQTFGLILGSIIIIVILVAVVIVGIILVMIVISVVKSIGGHGNNEGMMPPGMMPPGMMPMMPPPMVSPEEAQYEQELAEYNEKEAEYEAEVAAQ
jgi:hypothetical protein